MRAIEAAGILRGMPEITRQVEHLVHVDGVQLEHAAIRLGLTIPDVRRHLIAARDARQRWAAYLTKGGEVDDNVTDDEILALIADGYTQSEARYELGVPFNRIRTAVARRKRMAAESPAISLDTES